MTRLWKPSTQKRQDVRLDRAEKTARDHARRLLRLEAEVGIYRPNPMLKERRP